MTAPGGYDAADLERHRQEEDRSPFAVDRARIVRSVAWRSLSDKTQVLDRGEGPAPRARLTHSLEVAHLAHAIGTPLGADPLLLELAGLAHDLGHPPFGHNGERALHTLAEPVGGFEGNAQTFRILTRLEPGPTGTEGLNLTRAALDATCKYPWPRMAGSRKWGVYDDDTHHFTWMRLTAPERQLCFEAQIMDWADDVASAVSDVDDALRARRLRPAVLADRQERAALADLAVGRFTSQSRDAVEEAAARLAAMPALATLAARGYDGTAGARSCLAALVEQLTSRLIREAVVATRTRYGEPALTRYRAGLVVPDSARAEAAYLKAVILHHVLHDPMRRTRRGRQRELLSELHHALRRRPPTSTTERGLIDHIASLTEHEAVAEHARLLPGQKTITLG
ncbi:deoxyguanosinetriphosphate triphosphohydrolase [Streptomyces nanshensis]|uniref:HD domain-containing protein n=1 Tax=Streptomyces nanshensis TaxID=518642 RepID=A0A1E7KZD3_9ACTN|nr:deoxyguanosinetriphosphate triphosphohydrolase [Streptomyces nanshensis]OEV09317.1 hypothetical protein AN218_23065 [Streptomyces nanshensis]